MKFKKYVILITILVVTGCSSAPVKTETPEVLPAEKEAVLVKELKTNLIAKHGHYKNEQVYKFLKTVANQISLDTEFLILATENPLIAAMPGNQLVISLGLLKTIRYENELAFLLALNMALNKDRMPSKRLAMMSVATIGTSLFEGPFGVGSQRELDFGFLQANWFDVGGVFDFGELVYLDSFIKAVAIISDAHYDMRGANTLLETWGQQGFQNKIQSEMKIWPKLEEFQKNIRDEVAKNSPSRDPIVKGLAFDGFLKNLQNKSKRAKK